MFSLSRILFRTFWSAGLVSMNVLPCPLSWKLLFLELTLFSGLHSSGLLLFGLEILQALLDLACIGVCCDSDRFSFVDLLL